jgi:hypothetical protein
MKEFPDALYRGKYIPYSVIPACRESLWGNAFSTIRQQRKERFRLQVKLMEIYVS